MSEQPKKRPWFQFHLSTAVTVMFVAAAFLGTNMCGHNTDILLQEHRMGDIYHRYAFGWPSEACYYIAPANLGGWLDDNGKIIPTGPLPISDEPAGPLVWDTSNFVRL
ncbi:MAG: hypothetical protein NTW87_04125 [Planctomycetota bacterium]|nr:hypothetical protein [Planctomycetota bacterium]